MGADRFKGMNEVGRVSEGLGDSAFVDWRRAVAVPATPSPARRKEFTGIEDLGIEPYLVHDQTTTGILALWVQEAPAKFVRLNP